MYIYIYIYIYIYMYIYIYTSKQKMHLYMYVWTHTCSICAWMLVYTQTAFRLTLMSKKNLITSDSFTPFHTVSHRFTLCQFCCRISTTRSFAWLADACRQTVFKPCSNRADLFQTRSLQFVGHQCTRLPVQSSFDCAKWHLKNQHVCTNMYAHVCIFI